MRKRETVIASVLICIWLLTMIFIAPMFSVYVKGGVIASQQVESNGCSVSGDLYLPEGTREFGLYTPAELIKRIVEDKNMDEAHKILKIELF